MSAASRKRANRIADVLQRDELAAACAIVRFGQSSNPSRFSRPFARLNRSAERGRVWGMYRKEPVFGGLQPSAVGLGDLYRIGLSGGSQPTWAVAPSSRSELGRWCEDNNGNGKATITRYADLSSPKSQAELVTAFERGDRARNVAVGAALAVAIIALVFSIFLISTKPSGVEEVLQQFFRSAFGAIFLVPLVLLAWRGAPVHQAATAYRVGWSGYLGILAGSLVVGPLATALIGLATGADLGRVF